MEHLSGETLAVRLIHLGTLPITAALRVLLHCGIAMAEPIPGGDPNREPGNEN